MLAIALKFIFVLIIGVRAVIAAVFLLASDDAFALRVFAFVLPLNVHDSLLKPRFAPKPAYFGFHMDRP